MMPKLETLEDLVESFASRGETEAVEAFGLDSAVSVSYAALHARIRGTAAGLAARGIGEGDFVLICGPNGPAWIAAYFATVSLGAAAIPVDDQSTKETVAAVLRHSGAKFAFTTARHIEDLAGTPEALQRYALLEAEPDDPHSMPRLERDAGRAQAPPDAPAVRRDPARIASLLYTSGTTGTPKAVPLTHANLVSNANALMEADLIRASDRVLLPLPLHHSYPFTVGLLLVLGAGATLVLPSGISGPEITGALKSGRATAMLGVPSLYAAVWQGIEARAQARGERTARMFKRLLALSRGARRFTGLRLGKWLFRPVHANIGSRLRILGCGGAKLDAQLAENLETLGWTVLSGYGLTETSPVLTFNSRRVRRLDSEGRPIPGVEIKIAQTSSASNGEVLARGPNVFAGYWKNPEATAAAFTPDGWFRTGDLGWIDAEGFLHVAGRLKEVIVLADGKNVFPEDVEPAYAASPLLREIAILEQNGVLVALVVPDEDEVRRRGGLSAVRMLGDELDRIARQLPPYQRIADFRAVREPLPRTRLGKLRRHLLNDIYERAAKRSLEEQPVVLSEEDARLIGTSEKTRAVWEWLERRYPDRHLYLDMSPQLDLSIDSLGWVSLTLELEQRFGISLPGAAVSRVLTLRDLLTEVHRAEQSPESHRKSSAAPRAAPAAPGPAARAIGTALFALDRLVMRMLFKLRVEGADALPRDAPIVVTPNHVSYLDPPAIAAALPRSVLSRVHWAGWVGIMYAGPLMRLVSRATRVFPVDPDQDLAGAIGTARAVLEQGGSLVWFPEGRRSPDGSLLPFRPGIGVLLKGQSCLVVPTLVRGTYAAWPINRKIPKPAPVSVSFGRAVTVAELAAEGRGESEEARIVSGLEARLRRLAGETATDTGVAGIDAAEGRE
ncbi:MAG TPA: AMP-binding protein [Gammaproteobacteria bacterium]|nr:AMP-binding protein [Gammaproteobacteria bacterium]